jgi:hypothetical protein
MAAVATRAARPGLSRLSLIGAVVIVASQLVLMPAPPTLTLTGRHAAITPLGNLRTRPE